MPALPERCARCGSALLGGAPDGLCAACLLETGLGQATSDAEAGVGNPRLANFGDYDLLEEIARGGMGVVFKARQRSLDRVVAVKMILSGHLASEAEVQRFLAEARAAATLQHPNIVAIHEVGACDGRHFFSMDYVEGGNLAQLVRDGPIPSTRAAQCVKTIAEAIHYAHERGILHRDLKPSNVLVDRDGHLHVTDFGLAKRLDIKSETDLTLTGQVLGSPNFMPPEQAAGRHRELTPAADVYSLGALLYHLMTGRPPFLGENVPATLRLVAETEPIPPRLLAPTLPGDLETVCLKCLEKEPGKRFASARELADELRRFLNDEPIHARPVGRWEKFHRWTRRHPVIAALTGIIGLLLFAVALISTLAAVRLQRANHDARQKLREAYLSEARASRWSGRTGRRFNSLEALAKAAAIRPDIDLRNEAIAAMALVDLNPVKSWEVPAGSRFFGLSAAYDRYMRGATNAPFTLHRVADDREIARLPVPPPHFQWAALSPSGNLLSACSGTNASRLDIFRWGEASPTLTLTNLHIRSHDFSSDDRLVAIGGRALSGEPKYKVLVLDVSSGQTNLELTANILPSVGFNLEADKLAVFGVTGTWLQLHAVPSGQLLPTLVHSEGVYAVDWARDGHKLAAAGWDGDVYLWDLTKPEPSATRLRHGGVVTAVSFSPDGGLLASRGWSDLLRLWDTRTGRELLRQANSGLFGFSLDGRQLAVWPSPHRVELCEVASAREIRVLQTGRASACRFSPDGRLMATTHEDGVRFWELPSGRGIGFLPERHAVAAFFGPQGDALFTASQAGMRRWTLTQRRADGTNFIDLAGHPFLCGGKNLEDASPDRFGRHLAALHDGWIEVYDTVTRESLFTRSRQDHIASLFWRAALSPDGKWVAAWEQEGGGAHVWEMNGADRGRKFVPGASGVAFSPDGQWFVTGAPLEYLFWDMKTWQPRHRIPRPINAGVHAPAVFSPDSRTVALRFTERTFALFTVADGEHLATFESPADARLGACVFNARGDLLAAPDADSGGVVIWDLRAIRQRLAPMGLDWNAPPIAAHNDTTEAGEWRVTFEERQSP